MFHEFLEDMMLCFGGNLLQTHTHKHTLMIRYEQISSPDKGSRSDQTCLCHLGSSRAVELSIAVGHTTLPWKQGWFGDISAQSSVSCLECLVWTGLSVNFDLYCT